MSNYVMYFVGRLQFNRRPKLGVGTGVLSAVPAFSLQAGLMLLRIGADHQRDPDLLRAILDECERAGVYAMYTPSMANDIINTGEEGFPMQNLISNITAIKDHPALWGYYIW